MILGVGKLVRVGQWLEVGAIHEAEVLSHGARRTRKKGMEVEHVARVLEYGWGFATRERVREMS